MIDAARKAKDEGKIDSYEVAFQSPGYKVIVISGKSVGEGLGETEEAAFSTAQKDLGKAK